MMTSNLVCDFCGTSFEKFNQTKKLGCENCYYSFSGTNELSFLNKILSENFRISSSVRSSTKSSDSLLKSNTLSIEEEIKFLELRLDSAIKLEDYEEAARIRDSIKELKGG